MNILNPFMAQMDMNQLKKRIEFSSFHIVKYSSIEFLSKFPNLEYILNEVTRVFMLSTTKLITIIFSWSTT